MSHSTSTTTSSSRPLRRLALRTLGVVMLASIAAMSGCNTGEEEDGSSASAEVEAASPIKHVVVIVQENHTFDTYFGRYCKLKPGEPVPPSCAGDTSKGPECCEAAPDTVKSATFGIEFLPRPLGDFSNTAWGFDRNHESLCEYAEMNCNKGGKPDEPNTTCDMDRFIDLKLKSMLKEAGPFCGSALFFRNSIFEESVEANHDGAVSLSDFQLLGKLKDVSLADWKNNTHWSASNWAISPDSEVRAYHRFAAEGALGDRYFQPAVGQTSSNDMFLATAQFEFRDNTWFPDTLGSKCQGKAVANEPNYHTIKGRKTIADLLLERYDEKERGLTRNDENHWVDQEKNRANLSGFGYYHFGYGAMTDPKVKKDENGCPVYTKKELMEIGCPEFVAQAYAGGKALGSKKNPGVACMNDPSDNPFRYFEQFGDKGKWNDALHDYDDLAKDVKAGKLPAVAYVKAVTALDEHPAFGPTSAGQQFVQRTVDTIMKSDYAKDTLILVTWDEGGGFYDHISPPVIEDPHGAIDGNGRHTNSDEAGPGSMRLGTRVPILAIGKFAATNTVSHVQMEHSSIVKFLEWNFLAEKAEGGEGELVKKTGQLHGRDLLVNNIGSLLKEETGVPTGKAD